MENLYVIGTYQRSVNKLLIVFFNCILLVLLLGFSQRANAQTADFVASSLNECTPASIDFTTGSGATTYLWKFGNSNISSVQNVSATYPRPGVYTVTLIVDEGLPTEDSTQQTINVYPAPRPSLNAQRIGCELYSTTLDVQATPVTISDTTYTNEYGSFYVGAITGGYPETFTWNFLGALPTIVTTESGGATSSSISLTDLSAGVYDLLLTVEDEHGCSKTEFIQDAIIVNATPTADFSFIKENLCGLGNVSFTGSSDISFGIISQHAWDIGNDGSIESINPNYIHNFTVAGNYDVAYYVTSADGCVSEKVIKQVILNGNNQIDFSFAGNCAGSPVSFIDGSSEEANIVSWEWDFNNDGIVDSYSQDPFYTYATAGDKTVKLIVTFNDGCIMETTKTVSLSGATANFTYDTSGACAPIYSIGFTSTSTSTSGITITGYAWDFDNNGTTDDSSQNPTNDFNASGTFLVKLTVTTSDNCTNSALINVVIPATEVDFSVSPDVGCAPLSSVFTPIYFNDSDPIESYSWDFGDPPSGALNTSVQENPTHIYASAGDYTANLTVITTNGCSLTAQQFVKVGSPQEITNITVTPPTNSCQTGSFDFEATITTLVDSVVWSFSDQGTTEIDTVDNQTSSSISHDFNYPSQTHWVSATAYYNGCPSTVYTVSDIVVNEPSAGFTTSATTGCSIPTTIVFTNTSVSNDANTVYTWDFGDGTPVSHLKDDSHTYTDAGDFMVTLTVENTLTGCTDIEILRYIRITTATVNFSVDNTIACAGSAYSVNFTSDLSIKSANFRGESYLWDFGDGQTSDEANPTHSYADPGLYDVSLQVTEANNCEYTETKTTYLDVRGPIVSFTNTPAIICSGTSVSFTNTSSKATNDPALLENDTYLWTFGDGNSSEEPDPVHVFTAPGTYNVTLQVTDENGCVSSHTEINSVEVPNLVAGFTSRDVYCLGDVSTFNASSTVSTASIKSYDWDLNGDGDYEILGGASIQTLTFPSVGFHTVNFRVTNNIDCTDDYTKTFEVVDGTGTFTFNPATLGCAPVNVQFLPTDPALVVSSYLWTFGDGGTSVGRTPGSFYKKPGNYIVTLQETLTGGCIKTSSQTITVAGAVGTFRYDNTPGCAPHPENYYAEHLYSVDGLTWDFGDGIITNETELTGQTSRSISHTYTTWGTRLPILILRDAACGDYAYYYGQDQRINTSEAPNANYTFESIEGETCEGQTFQFTDGSSIVDPRYPIGTWYWDFGDGTTSTEKNPMHSYSSADTFDVILRVRTTFVHVAPPDVENCWAEITKSVIVNALPDISATNQSQLICSGQTSDDIVLSSTMGTATFSWERDNPSGISTAASLNGTTSTISGAVFNNTTTAPIQVIYVLTPIGPTPTFCNGNTITATVTVNPVAQVNTQANVVSCNNSAVDVNFGTVNSGGTTTYTWTNSNTAIGLAGATGSGNISFTSTNVGATTISSTIVVTPHYTNASGGVTCDGPSKTFTISITPTPNVTATANEEFCSGGTSSIGLSTTVPGTTFYYATPTISPGGVGAVTGVSSRPSPGNTNGITDILMNTTAVKQTVTYTVYPIIDGCVGSSISVAIIVNPVPVLTTGLTQTLCADGSGNATASRTLSTSPSMVSPVYSWGVPTLTGGMTYTPHGTTGNSIIDDFNNVTSTQQTATYSVTPTASAALGGCVGLAKNVVIRVNPRPVVANQTTTICSDSPTGFTLPAGTGVAATTFNITNIVNGGLAASAGIPTFPANGKLNSEIANDAWTNTTTSPVNVVYTVVPVSSAGCSGSSFTVTVTVNPEPVVINQIVTTCSDSPLGLTLGNDANTPQATSYNITNITSVGLTASAGSPITANGVLNSEIFNDAWTNVTSGNRDVVYTVVPISASGCLGDAFTVTATIKNEPVGTNTTTASQCSHLGFSFDPQTHISNSTTSSFTWTASYDANLTGGAGSGTGLIAETLTNNTTGVLYATYAVSPTSNPGGCTGSTFTITVPVSPESVVANKTTSTCSDVANLFDIIADSGIAVETINITGITTNGLTASAGSIPSSFPANGLSHDAIANDEWTNINSLPVDVIYTVVPVSAAGCAGTPFTVTVTVNPEPVVAAQTITTCSDTPLGLTLGNDVDTPQATTYNITNITSVGLTASAGSPTTANGVLNSEIANDAWTNVTTGNRDVVYTVVPISASGCQGDAFTVTATIEPEPAVTSASSLIVCSGSAVNYTPTSQLGISTKYSWTSVNNVGTVTGYGSKAIADSNPISDVLTIVGSAEGEVTYTITPESVSGCIGTDFKLVVTVVNCNPIIGVAKQLVSLDYNVDGTYDALFNIRVQNYGNLVLEDIQVVENLTTAFGGTNYTVLGLSSTSFDVNTAFTGVGNLLDNSGTSNTLAVGASTDIQLRVNILSDGTYSNTVTASSSTGGVFDVSQDGSDPDPNSGGAGDGDPTNNNDPTPIEIVSCSLTASGIVNTICSNSAGEVILTGSEAGTVSLNGTEQASPATYSNLQAGWYNATFFASATGCVSNTYFEIANSDSDLAGSVTAHSDVTCNGDDDGQVTVTASGGTPSYSYKLNGVDQVSNTFSNLAPGEYGCQITDDNGCTYTVSFDIDEPTVLVSSIVATSVSCIGGSDGTATVDVTGGTTPYNYEWDDAATQTTATATGLDAGTLYTVTITDDNGCQTSSSVTLSAETCDPIAVNDNIITPEDTPVSGDVRANDTDPNGLSLTVTQFEIGGTIYAANSTANIPGIGTLELNDDGTFTFSPVANYFGAVPVATYTITNGTNSSTANLNITVTPVNDLPVVVADTFNTAEDTSVSGNLAINDMPSGDGGNIWSVDTNPSNGSVIINPDGTFTYIPDADYTGPDSFSYKLCDTDGNCASETVVINVSQVNDNPVAVDDFTPAAEDTPIDIYVVNNDNFGGDGPSTTTALTIVTPPINGTAVVNENGTINDPTDDYIEYTPNPNFNGNDSFVYEICDANGDCDQATAVVNVNSVNDSPIAVADTASVTEDNVLNGTLATNDTISGDGGNVWSVVTNPTHGTVVVNLDGTYTYTPDENYDGTDGFTYKLCDGDGSCSTASVSITVDPVNDPPVIADVPKTGTEDNDITFQLSDFTSKFTDIDGDTLTRIEVVSLPSNGTLYLSGSPVAAGDTITKADLSNLTFTPNSNWNGTTSFDWNGFDGTEYASINEQVNIIILPVNDPPVAGISTMESQENPGGTDNVTVLANSFSGTDVDGTITSLLITTMPTNATSITVDGITYTTIPGGGISVATTPAGQPLFDIEIDPVDGDASSVLSYFVIDNEGLISDDPGTVTIPFSDIMTIDAGNDAEICSSDVSYNLAATATNYYSLIWSTNGTGSFNSTNIEDPVYTPSIDDVATGQIQLTLTGTGVGGDVILSDMMVLTVWPAAAANAGSNVSICSNEPFVLTSATASNYTSITWTSTGGSFDNIHALNPTFTPSSTGNITLTLTAEGLGTCSDAVSSMVLTVNSPIVLSTPSVTGANCDSQEDGSVVLEIVSGGTSPFTFELSTGESITHNADTAAFTTLAAGGYIYWVTDANGCTAQGSFEVDDPNELELTVISEIDETCIDDNNGSATLEASGGTAPYSFVWSGGIIPADLNANPNTVTDLPAGFYVVTVTDANGCSEIESLEIVEPKKLNIVLVDQINADCDNSGQIIVNGIGGTPPYSFTSTLGTVFENIISGLLSGLDTIEITDFNGCVDTLIVDLLDVDETAPTVSCPGTQTLTAGINCTALVPDLTVLVSASDNCSLAGAITISQSIAENTEISSNVTVTVTATDEAGNATSCDVLLEIEDTTNPVAHCRDLILQLDMTGKVYISAEDVNSGSTDNCGITSLSIDITSFDCDDVATSPHTVTLTVTDDSGNMHTCTSSVTIEDNISPIVDCPVPVTLIADLNCSATVPDFVTGLNVSNNCSDVTVTQSPLSGATITTGVTIVTITVDDGTNISTCTTNVTVIDETAPTFTCPETQMLYSDANCQDTVPDLTALITNATDNCTGTGNISITQSVLAGTLISSDLTVTVTVSDSLGNSSECDVLLVMQDTTPPTADCKDITMQLDVTGYVHITPEDIEGNLTDNCGLASMAIDVHTFTCDSLGDNPVVLTVTDDAGNISTCISTVTIVDNIKPVLDCPAPVILVADANCQAATPDFSSALSNNNCGSAMITQFPLADSLLTVGVTPVIVVATDGQGNADTCITTVTVIDETAPTFTCPESQMLYSDINCQDTVPDLTALITNATDNCTGDNNISITQSVLAGTLISSDLTVTVTVSDSLGNSAECDVLLVMQDTTPPTPVCKNITLQLDMTGYVHISPEDVDNGSFDNCGLASLSIDVSTFTCDSIGINPVILTVTDDAGNTSSCPATVTIEDNVDPILDCPAPVTLIADENCQAPAPDFVSALSNNNCGMANVTQIPLAGTPLTVGITVVTVVATDSENNTDTCFTAVTVIDETAPTFTCVETQMLYSDINCQDTVPDFTVLITDATDNCTGSDNISISQSVLAGTLISSDLTVTVTVSDSLGNSAFCDVLLVMQDTTPPTATCRDIEVQLDMTGWIHITPEDIDGGSFDNCGLSSMSIDIANFDCTQVGENDVILTLTDDAGNSSTCTSTVTIIDNADPILDCPAPVTLNANSRCQALVPDFSDALSNNNCGTATITQSPLAYTPRGLGEHIITITATDDAGNTDVCTTTVTIIDVTPPTFSCPETITMGADSNCEARVPFLTSRISDARDNCSSVTLTQSIAGNTLISNDITVTVTATDNSGNSTSCDVLIRVKDDRPPVAICRDISLQLDMTGQVYISPEDVDNGSYDNCGIASLSLDVNHFDCSNIGENIVYLTVTDDAGNTADCFARVTIEDNINPILDCPAPLTLSADENCQAIMPDFTDALSSNNCGTAAITQTPEAGTFIGEGLTVVTVVATDSEGNTATCVTTVTVLDNTAPTFSCPPNQVLFSDAECKVIVPDLAAMVTAIDNCSTPVVTQSVAAGTTISSDLTVTVSATDLAGNETRCDVLLEVRDTTPPTAICKDIILNLDMTGTIQISAEDVNMGSFDNCGLASMAIDVTTFTCDDLGENSIVLTVTDDAGNVSSCTARVTIEDNIDPILDCPAPVTLNADRNCQAAIPDFTGALSSNNCGTVTVSQSILAGTLVAKGLTTVTITATDEAGNTAECTVNVTVVDTIPPVYTCSVPLAVNTDEGECFSDVTLVAPVVSDNCDSTDISIEYRVYEPNNFISNLMNTSSLAYKFRVGINQVEWIMTDQSGNVSVCFQEVEVSENEAPVITCPEGPFIFSNTIGECGFIISDTRLDAFATDNCGEVTLNHNYGDWAIPNSLQGATFPVGVTSVIWSAIDAVGNISTCSMDIIVTDDEAPEFINCPSGSVFNVGLYNGECEGSTIWSVPVATDNCSAVVVTQTGGPEQASDLAVGEYSIQYTATDGSGNKSYCNFTINVMDTEVPVIVCQSDLIKENDFGKCSWTSGENDLSPLLASSNCTASINWVVENPDASTVSGVDDVSGYVFDLGTSIVHYYIVENVSGQESECSFSVTVIDAEAPVVECQPALQITALPGECFSKVELVPPTFTNNCSIESNSITYRVFGADNSASGFFTSSELIYNFEVGINRVEWRVEDEVGNYSLCLQEVWIEADNNETATNAGSNISILETESVTIEGAIAPEYATISWSSSGSGEFGNPESVVTTYTPSVTDRLDGFVILTITSSTACTSVSDQMVLSFFNAPVVSAGVDDEICETGVFQLFGSIFSNVASVEWYVIGSGTLNNNQIINPIYTPSQEDILAGAVQIVFVGKSNFGGIATEDTLNLNINRQPIISAGENATWLCESEAFLLSDASLEFGESVLWTTSGTGVFDADVLLNATYYPSEADILNGSVILRVLHESEGACGSVSDHIVLNFSNHPTVDAGKNRTTCFNQPVQITEAFAKNFNAVLWTSNGGGTIANANTLSPTYTPAADETGSVILTMQVMGENGCIEDTIYDEVEIQIYPQLVVDAGDDATIYYNTTTMLSVSVENGSGSYFYNWYPAGFVYDNNVNYTETTNLLSTIEFEVIVSDANTNCTASDIKKVYVDEVAGNLVSFYSGFSPNHDGVNDTWSIKGIEKFPDNEVMFFNRWGDKVNEYQDYDNITVAWDGTNNRGKPLPDGTYYYIVNLNGVDSYTGWVHIRTDR